MDQNNANSAELANLIDQAKRVVSAQAERQNAQTTRSLSTLLRVVIQITVFLLLVYLGFSLWTDNISPSEQKVGTDLEHILYVARDAIEGARSADGKLPESIPNASIAAVVQYEVDSQRYKLSTTIMGVRATLEQDGKVITHYGVEK